MTINPPPTCDRDRPFFPFAGIVDAVSTGDTDAALCDAATLHSMSFAVLKCLYTTMTERCTSECMSREEVADVVAAAAGMLELQAFVECGAVGETQRRG